MPAAYAAAAEIDFLLAAFARAEIPREHWNHVRHLTFAADAAHACADFGVTLATIRAGILRYNTMMGIETTPTSGYHETVTHFWTRKVVDLLQDGEDRLTYVNRVVDRLADGALVFTHYSKDTLMSPAARAAYVAPDLRPL